VELNPRRPAVTDAYAEEEEAQVRLAELIPLLERIAESLERIEQLLAHDQHD